MKRTMMGTLKSVAGIKDAYTKRILSNVIGKDAFAMYCQTPSRLQHLVQGLNDRELHTPAERGKWSVAQIVNHLCDADVVFGYRVRMMLAQSGSRIQAYDEKAWAKNLRYGESDCREKLDLFVHLRKDYTRLLQSLGKREWSRFGIHEERGKETIERLVQMYAGHDVNHLRQIGEIRKTLLKVRKH